MSDANSMKKGPIENTQIPTPENITGIPGVQEKVSQITMDAGLQIDIDRKLEKIGNNKYLNDIFRITKKGEIEIRSDSKLLEGHFPGVPLIPGIILEKLYEHLTGIKLDKGDTTINFDDIIIPGHKVVVKTDGIYTNGIKVFSLTGNPYNIPFINKNEQIPNGPKTSTDIEPSQYLLQSDPILLAKSSNLKTFEKNKLNIGDEITGEIDIKMLDENGNPDYHFLKEGAAQVLSSGVSYILNGGEILDSKGDKFNIMTFKTILSKSHKFPSDKIEKVFVEAQVINVGKRDITSSYLIKNEKGYILQEGIISGTKIEKGVLNRNHRKTNTALKKDMLINKIDNLVRDYGLDNYLSIDKDKGTITINKKLSINILKTLYLEIFQDVDINNLNQNYYNTIINEGDILDIKFDGLYKNGKEIIKTPKKRLEENKKLSEIFIINGNRIEIDNKLIGKYKNEEIENLLIELQNLLTQNKKVNIYGDNANYVVNNRYKPDEQIYFDEIKGIYVIKEKERVYFFDKITQNHIIINKND
ncbi:MAG: hypothetical protein WC850_01265 [Candidatus Gracilibacteria bacterium]